MNDVHTAHCKPGECKYGDPACTVKPRNPVQPSRAVIRKLEAILAHARALMPASENDDPQMFQLVGAIVANAEDALGALKDQKEREEFDAAIRGGIRGPGRR